MVNYPKDWEEKNVKDFGYVVTGNTPSTNVSEYWGRTYTWITPTDINHKIFISSSERRLTEKGYSVSRRLPSGSVLVTCIASIGKNCILQGLGSCNQQINAICVNDRNYNLFIYYLMEFNKQYIENLAGITATKILKKQIFENIKFTVPPFPEQQAIADALIAFDTHINNLSKLIEKKKMIHDGVVEELVSGKRRLAGFSGEWETAHLYDLLIPYGGLSGKNSRDFLGGNTKYISYLNVFNNTLITSVNNKVVIHPGERQNVVGNGDILFTQSSETVEEVGMASTYIGKEDVYLNSFCFGSKKKRELDSIFMVSLLRSKELREQISKEGQGSTRYNLSPNRLMNICVTIPPSLPEQQAIADILTAMDKEIADLEEEKEKYVALKAGAMDDLLTGKIRLV